MATLGKILTIDNLRRRGLTLVNWCCLCKKSEETVNLILIHFEFTSEIFHLVLILFGVSWAMLGNILELNVERCRGQDNPQRPSGKSSMLCLFGEKELDVFLRTASLMWCN